MRRLFIFLTLFLATNCTSLSGIIFEIGHFNEIYQHLKPDILVILDIDDTLLIPSQTLGCDASFLYRRKQLEEQGYSYTEALEKALAQWEAIRNLTQVSIVEEGTEKIIQDLQNKKMKVIALTTQGIALATRTVWQLNSLNIDLTLTPPSNEDFYFTNEHGVLFRHGILFTSGTRKGTALMKLLNHLNYNPKTILFINDKLTHLKDVEEFVEAAGIEFIGLRYSYRDEAIRQFRPEIADIQWKHSSFEHILTDEEAEALLRQ